MSVDYGSLRADEVEEERILAALGDAHARVVVNVNDHQVELTAHGRRLLSLLLAATSDRVAAVEVLLESSVGVPAFLSPQQAASYLGVSRPTVVRWINEGLLTDRPVGAHHRVPESEVLDLVRRRDEEALAARVRARNDRQALIAVGVDLDVEPTPDEAIEAGLQARVGDAVAARSVELRARRAQAREAALAAARPE